MEHRETSVSESDTIAVSSKSALHRSEPSSGLDNAREGALRIKADVEKIIKEQAAQAPTRPVSSMTIDRPQATGETYRPLLPAPVNRLNGSSDPASATLSQGKADTSANNKFGVTPDSQILKDSPSDVNGSPLKLRAPDASAGNFGIPDVADPSSGSVHLTHASSTPQRGTPRGRPRGRTRGSTGRSTASGRRGKRKRTSLENEDGSDDGGDSDSSEEVYTPLTTTTKSGRTIQKPTAFVPQVSSPSLTLAPGTTGGSAAEPRRLQPVQHAIYAADQRRRRPFHHRSNPDAAVCVVCLRGTSPAANMIVFCDECNEPYHRYCHHPAIDQSVVDEVDKEWFCRRCVRSKVTPAPFEHVQHFVGIGVGVDEQQRSRYFSLLRPGVLVTLLTKATTLHPDLPVFEPGYQFERTVAQVQAASAKVATPQNPQPPTEISSNGTHQQESNIQQNKQPHPGQHSSANLPVSVSETLKPLSTTTQDTPAIPNKSDLYHSDIDTSSSLTPIQSSDNEENAGFDHSSTKARYDSHPSAYPRPGRGLMNTLPPDKIDADFLVDDENDQKSGAFAHFFQLGKAHEGGNLPHDTSKTNSTSQENNGYDEMDVEKEINDDGLSSDTDVNDAEKGNGLPS